MVGMLPGKVMLTVEEVAQVLGRTGAGGYEQTREQLAAGVIVPGLRKVGGSWLVPITALAAALDSLVQLDDEVRAAPKALPARRAVLPSNPLVDLHRRAHALKQGEGGGRYWPRNLRRLQRDMRRRAPGWLNTARIVCFVPIRR